MLASQPSPIRTSRKRLKTKELLLRTMQEFVLEHGYEKTLISEMTEKADIAMGTFYNYYESKAEIMDDVFDLVSQSYHLEVDQLTHEIDDPAIRVAASLNYSLQRVTKQSDVGKLLFDSGISADRYTKSIFSRGYADVITGSASKRFTSSDPQVTASMVFGGSMAVAQGLYHGALCSKAISPAIESALLMFGLSHIEAKAISSKKFAPVKSYGLPISLRETIERTSQSPHAVCFVETYKQYQQEEVL